MELNSPQFSRRTVLQALVASPLVGLSGCERPSRLTGQIVGASMDVGHRLRKPQAESAPPPEARESEVVIIGSGLSGLTAGWRLLRNGIDRFRILELEPVAGGTARSGTCPASPYPWGAHYVPAPFAENRELIELLAEIGAVESIDAGGRPIFAEQALCREPEERVFADGEWHEGLFPEAGAGNEDRRQLAAFRKEVDRWIAWRDSEGRRAFTIPTALASKDPEVLALDAMTMAEWMDARGFQSPRLRWLVDYSCRDDFGSSLEQTSAWAGLFYFAARVREPGAESQPLLTWPAGLGHIVEHLRSVLSNRIETGVCVSRITPSDSGNPQIVVSATGSARGEPLRYVASAAILAVPQFVVPYLVPGLPEDRKSASRQFEYGSWLVANLHLRDRPPSRGFELAWDNVLYGSRSLGYVVATHQSGRDHGPTVWTWYLPLCEGSPREAREWLAGLTWEQAVGLVLADLETAHPTIREFVEEINVMRWGHAMVRSRPGFITSEARRLAAMPWQGLHFAGTDLSGVPLFEEALFHGVRAADEVRAAVLERHS